MGILDFIGKLKYKRISREEVTDAIYQLETEEAKLEKGVEEKSKEIAVLMEKGRTEKSRDMKLFYAKKISHLEEMKAEDTKRAMYLLYNIKMMNKLKSAIDQNQFFKNSGKVSLGNLLKDQRGLAAFLNEALNTRVKAEDVLTSADDTFKEIESYYEENGTIYGVNEKDDELLSIFEIGDESVNADSSLDSVFEEQPEEAEAEPKKKIADMEGEE